jgi:hypothetical protein
MPDGELLSQAADHRLQDPKTLESQVRRMIATRRRSASSAISPDSG